MYYTQWVPAATAAGSPAIQHCCSRMAIDFDCTQ